jgi:hypothetical protein
MGETENLCGRLLIKSKNDRGLISRNESYIDDLRYNSVNSAGIFSFHQLIVVNFCYLRKIFDCVVYVYNEFVKSVILVLLVNLNLSVHYI